MFNKANIPEPNGRTTANIPEPNGTTTHARIIMNENLEFSGDAHLSIAAVCHLATSLGLLTIFRPYL